MQAEFQGTDPQSVESLKERAYRNKRESQISILDTVRRRKGWTVARLCEQTPQAVALLVRDSMGFNKIDVADVRQGMRDLRYGLE